MNLINDIISNPKYHESFSFNSSEIILKINRTEINNILYDEYIDIKYPCPLLVYLNDEIQNIINCSKININRPESFAKLVWNNPLNSN